ncbi:MFS transporter [Parasphingorhabdus sp.]|uniref:MFS transporter n=1 Tax=Parasphingorhabdus sp. TaxID=2709688 RepID=UPI003A95B05B
MTAPKDKSADGAPGEFSLGWTVLLAALLGVTCGASPIPFNLIAFTVEPLSAEFGWSRTEIIFPATIYGLIASFLAPLFGWMADRYGVRPVALWSLFAFGIALAAIALTPISNDQTTLYTYYGLWIIIGLVGIGSTPVTWSRAINLWFFKHRGLALGILLLGTSIAALIVPKIAVWAIAEYGWRNMFAIMALLPLLIALPVAYFLFRDPTPAERPRAIGGADGRLTGMTLSRTIRGYRFHIMWVSITIVAGCYAGAFINMPTILADKGLSAQTAASVMGVLGIGILVGRLLTGALLDRFWQGFVAFPLLCLPAITCVILLGDDVSFMMAAVAAFFLGFAAGAESDLIAYLAGRYFGMLHYGKIYGSLYMPFGIASALSSILYAYVRDVTGSYDAVLIVAFFGFIIGGALLLLLGRYPDNFDVAPEPSSDALPSLA